MNKKTLYIELAQEACQKERDFKWDEAYALWKLASEATDNGSVDEYWANCRAKFCSRFYSSNNRENPYF